ncbi:MAG: HipA domain-containing protein [Betaproteobacteria bacterium]|nr:HipA domain-containing protein [Betaproteobacteria bacterium]
MDRHAVIWMRTANGPMKMGDMVVTEHEARFAYAEEFLASGNPDGLALLASPALYGRETFVFRLRPAFPVPPRLMQFIPGHGRNNLQRRLYDKVLATRASPPAPGFDTDWEMMLLAGRNGIGHIDVFRDDRAAEAGYGAAIKRHPRAADRSAFWKAIREDIAEDLEAIDPDQIAHLLGPTPSAGGMIPKLLVAIPDVPSGRQSWNGDFAPAGTRKVGERRYIDALLKIEPREYEGVVGLESLCLDIHRESGFDVPRYWRVSIDGMQLLAVERFDRTASGIPVPMESFYSVFATGDAAFNGNEDTDIEEVGLRLEQLSSVTSLDHKAARLMVYRRFCLALCTGNGDMHLENLSFLGGPRSVRVAPVYDPAPMRAWPQHNVRSAIPIVFEEGTFRDNVIRVGRAFGLSNNAARDILDEMLDVTRNYVTRVMALQDVPDARKLNLARIVEAERDALGKIAPCDLPGTEMRG